MRFAHRAQQTNGDHIEDVPLPGGQGGEVGPGDLRRGDDGMVVGHLGAVRHLGGVHRESQPLHTVQRPGHSLAQRGQAVRHILRQIAAVRPGVGGQPLLVKALQIVKGFLGGVAEQPVGFPLEGGQVIQLGGPLCPLRLFHACHRDGCAQAGPPQLLRLRLGLDPPAYRRQPIQLQLHRVEFLLLKAGNGRFPLHQEGQRRGLNPAHIQR